MTLDEDQYSLLVDMVYIAHWVINAYRWNGVMEYDRLEQHLYTHHADFGETRIEYFPYTEKYYFTREAEVALHAQIDEYGDTLFWHELVSRLAARDAEELDKVRDLSKKTDQQGVVTPRLFMAKYEQEIRVHGLKRLRIVPVATYPVPHP